MYQSKFWALLAIHVLIGAFFLFGFYCLMQTEFEKQNVFIYGAIFGAGVSEVIRMWLIHFEEIENESRNQS